jgi:uncharacterized protein DUF4268
MDETTLRRPRIVLLARDFPTQVTAAAVWLNEMGLDVALIRFQAYRAVEQIVLTVSQMLPVPDVEEFTVAPQRAAARMVSDPDRERQRESTATRRLADADAVKEGTPFTLRPYGTLPESVRTPLQAWLAEDPRRATATWRNDPVRPLLWEADGQPYTPGGLVRAITQASTGEGRAVEGTRWWTDPDGFDLVELAAPYSGNRAPLYQEFWGLLLDHFSEVRPDWPLPKVSKQNWIDLPSGYRLAVWSLSFARGRRLRSEFYLEGGTSGADSRYHELEASAAQINAAYGSPLCWEPLPGKKACRIADYHDGEIERREEHEQYIDWFTTSQDRLRAAVAAAVPTVAWLSG